MSIVRPSGAMKSSALVTVLVLIALAAPEQGCRSKPPTPASNVGNQEIASPSDEHAFAVILAYYRQTFPSVTFESGGLLGGMVDGPLGRERTHVAVPVAVDKEYQHHFSRGFLASQEKSSDGLARSVAQDLLLLEHERLFSYTSRHGIDGVMIDCTNYVVRSAK
jgi:hypothetical protein